MQLEVTLKYIWIFTCSSSVCVDKITKLATDVQLWFMCLLFYKHLIIVFYCQLHGGKSTYSSGSDIWRM